MVAVQGFGQRLVRLQRRLTACEHDQRVRRGAVGKHPFGNRIGTHRLGVREIRVAERATQITPREAHEHRRAPRVVTLALQRIEDLVDAVHH